MINKSNAKKRTKAIVLSMLLIQIQKFFLSRHDHLLKTRRGNNETWSFELWDGEFPYLSVQSRPQLFGQADTHGHRIKLWSDHKFLFNYTWTCPILGLYLRPRCRFLFSWGRKPYKETPDWWPYKYDSITSLVFLSFFSQDARRPRRLLVVRSGLVFLVHYQTSSNLKWVMFLSNQYVCMYVW
jgi:hypothetical protein